MSNSEVFLQESAIDGHIETERKLQQVSGEAAKMGHELLTVYQEYGDTQEHMAALQEVRFSH